MFENEKSKNKTGLGGIGVNKEHIQVSESDRTRSPE